MAGIAESIKRRVIKDEEVEGVGSVRILRLSAGELLEFSEMKGDNRESGAWLIRKCVVDEADAPVFASDEEVWATDSNVLSDLTNLVMRVNGLSKEAVDDAKKELPDPPASP